MPEVGQTVSKLPAAKSSRRWWWGAFFLGWTILAAVIVWWLSNNTGSTEDKLIRIGPDEVKSWTMRLRETAALARLNSPWALAWILLAPYALWIGVCHSFENAQWRSRLAVLLVGGVAFIAASQWLSTQLGAGGAMIVMVNFSADTTIEKPLKIGHPADDSLPNGIVTNRITSNRVTKVFLSGAAAHTTTSPNWEVATSEILSGLPTNFSPMLAGKLGNLPHPIPPRTARWSAALDAFAYIALIGLAHAGVFHRRYREREQQATLLTSRLNEARLHALQAQLQPHFLFNTLNGIATLLRRDPAKAEDMLLSLSELLRIALSSSHRQEIPLREEMDFLGRYLAIQKMRFGDRIEVIEEVRSDAMDCLVPALLLQPLVENAIRHGLEPSGQPGQLRITGSRDGDWLKLAVEDNGVGMKPNSNNRTGVGLANVRERLATLHGTAYEFELKEGPQGGVAVSIRLPARTELAETGSAAVPLRGAGTGGGTSPELAGENARATKNHSA
ncbi:MAG: histidine kinase [Verrucomicrobiota bacterium]